MRRFHPDIVFWICLAVLAVEVGVYSWFDNARRPCPHGLFAAPAASAPGVAGSALLAMPGAPRDGGCAK